MKGNFLSLQQNLQRLYQQKDWKSLLEICNQELAKQPGQAQYYYLKAVSLSMLSQEQEARKNLEKCLALSPEFPNARDFLMSLEKRSSHAKISVDSQRTVSQSSSIDLKGSLDEKGTIVQDTHSGYSTQKGSLDEKGTIVQEKYDEKKIDQIKTLEQQEEKKLLEKNAEPGEEGDKRFGRYKILADLGEGGMGHVYKAFDPELKRVIALKVIRGDKVNQKQMDRFLREAQTTAKLHHPNIVSVYDIGVQDGWPFFTMDFIEGQGLDKYCKESLPKSDKLSIIFMKIAEAIQYAHDNGVIHRDIKPANIMITKDEQPKVMDFGLAKIAKEDQKISRSGAVLGTPAYMPPEQAQGKEVDARSDVYSIGATMYECLTGFPPFRTNNYTKLMQEIISKEPKLPRQYNPNIPQDLQTICMKCLEKPPLLRYQKAKHFWEDIKLFVEYKPIKARPASMYQKASKWIYRNRKMAAAGLLATLGFIVAFLWLRVNFSQTWEKEVYLQNKKILEKAKNHKKNQRYDLAREAWLEIKKDTAQYTEAQKELEEIRLFLEQTEKQGDLLSEKGLACESLEEIEEAKKCYEKILGCYPRHPQVYPKFLNMEKSVLEIKNKKHREARNFYDKAMLISSSPTLRIEDLENCYRLFSRAVEIDPSFADAYFQRGRTCQRRFMYKEAFKDYNQSIKLEPALSAAHYYRILMEYAIIMGEISDSGEDQVERKKELFDYLQKNPSQKDDVYAILLEAYACIEDIKPGGIAKAIEHCNSAEKSRPILQIHIFYELLFKAIL